MEPYRVKLDRFGPDPTGSNWIGSCRIASDRLGPDGIESLRIGSNRVKPDRISPDLAWSRSAASRVFLNFPTTLISASASARHPDAFRPPASGNAVRIAHVRSRSVFSNFPPRNIRLGKATRCDFSRNSGYFAVGDYNGYLSLFRLNHFDKY
ncbi:U3 small nucleolar RNA-associated protein 18 -like protein [Toxocara canis]|uniref:U3 small nucleolar RNA-associated protein 18-like protein n=1 Tax=Toxocara canis TaxID=6265 RepID=A0A0B2VXL7_TOXCA|nr:U3 small nucleolar RNA-associated protein 18 -like protein [Toxocara canis]